jgi:cell division protease FtsH
VKKIVTACMKRADKILEGNTDKLHLLANALLEREILDGEEIDRVLRGETLPPLEKKDDNGATLSVSAPVPVQAEKPAQGKGRGKK